MAKEKSEKKEKKEKKVKEVKEAAAEADVEMEDAETTKVSSNSFLSE